jgi:hypothetical protein
VEVKPSGHLWIGTYGLGQEYVSVRRGGAHEVYVLVLHVDEQRNNKDILL